jgi:hypothetical protein
MTFCLRTIDRRADILSVVPHDLALPAPTGVPLMIRYSNTWCGHQHEYNTSCGADLDSFKTQLTNAVEQNNLQHVSNLVDWFLRKVQRDEAVLSVLNQMEVDDDPIAVDATNATNATNTTNEDLMEL